MKFGFEYQQPQLPVQRLGRAEGGQFNFNRLGTAGYDASGNNLAATGDPFASFLLGQVQDATQTVAALSDVQRGIHGALGERRIQGVATT